MGLLQSKLEIIIYNLVQLGDASYKTIPTKLSRVLSGKHAAPGERRKKVEFGTPRAL